MSISYLQEAAELSAKLGPVECQLILLPEGVRIVALLDQSKLRREGGTVWKNVTVPWMQIHHCNCNPLVFWMNALRQEMLAEAEGPDSKNPNRERMPA
ncbi:MAG: hypothetical protein HQL44_17125 [Alphaproteobacteria bacterium]|nr:hypothetical protein [Alphaproteobacteria bacterium]